MMWIIMLQSKVIEQGGIFHLATLEDLNKSPNLTNSNFVISHFQHSIKLRYN